MPVCKLQGKLVMVYKTFDGKYVDAVDDPNWQAPKDAFCDPISLQQFEALHTAYPTVWTLVGTAEPENTKTVEEAFSNVPSDVDINALLGDKSMDAPIKKNVPRVNSEGLEDALMLFTKAAVEAHNAKGAKEKAEKKAFCNGMGRGILAMKPDLGDRLKKIAQDAKNRGDIFEQDESFI